MPRNYHIHLRGTVGYWNFSSEQVAYILDKHKDEEVHVLINSLGGFAYDGMTISALFRNHGNVHVHFISANASAATIASMGAARVTMDAGAMYLVHQSSNLVFEWDYMNADELDAHIKELKKLNDNQRVLDNTIAGMYARRCKKPQDDLLKLMQKERWLTPQEALDWGFIDEITDDGPAAKSPAIDEATLSAMLDAGMPIPPGYGRQPSVLSRLLHGLSSLFTNQNPDADAETAASDKTTSTMPDKTLTLLSALLGATLAFTGGNASITEAQASAIEDALADAGKKTKEAASLKAQLEKANASIKALEEKSSLLQKQVDELKDDAADVTDTVTEQRTTEDDGPGEDIAKASADLLSQI